MEFLCFDDLCFDDLRFNKSRFSAIVLLIAMRVVQNAFRLPVVLWCLLIIGGTVAVASASMFGSANTTLHRLHIGAFSLIVALALVAVADIDRPFQGAVHVSDLAFRRAQRNMKD